MGEKVRPEEDSLPPFNFFEFVDSSEYLQEKVVEWAESKATAGDKEFYDQFNKADAKDVIRLVLKSFETSPEGRPLLEAAKKLYDGRGQRGDVQNEIKQLRGRLQRADFDEAWPIIEKLHPLHERLGRDLVFFFRMSDCRLEKFSDDELVRRWISVQLLNDLDLWLVGDPSKQESGGDERRTEEELIDELNEAEYKLSELSAGPLSSNKATRRQDHRVKQLLEKLKKRHGGKPNRFGLAGKSKIELEHLQRETENDLQEMARDIARGRESLTDILSERTLNVLKAFGDVFPQLRPTPHKYQLFLKRKLLSEINLRLRTAGSQSAAEEIANNVADSVRETALTIALLEKQCEELIKKHPEQESSIRRRFSMAKDAILEKQ